MNDKARVAAAAAPKTRMSNVVIAPDVDWADGVAEVDKTELALTSAVALPVLLLVTANVL